MKDISVLQEEQRMLRNELQQLKGCQLKYFTLSVTGSAALFGWAATQTESAISAIAFLAPLSIILPCWWIFFDKATTITRIVGYYRVIERMIAEFPASDIEYIGYERALALYRKEDDGRGREEMEGYDIVQKTRSLNEQEYPRSHKKIRHRYWEINWYTYASLSFLCCLLSMLSLVMSSSHPVFHLIPSTGILMNIIFAWWTWSLWKDVVDGDYSYNENHAFWEFVHMKYWASNSSTSDG